MQGCAAMPDNPLSEVDYTPSGIFNLLNWWDFVVSFWKSARSWCYPSRFFRQVEVSIEDLDRLERFRSVQLDFYHAR